ncbi:hypothetical protein [Longispora urticae]
MALPFTATSFALPASGFEDGLVEAVGSELAVSGIARVTGFPGDPRMFVDFLAMLGEPLCYYGDSKGTHPDHPAIWRIRYEPRDAANGDAHAVAGPLVPHSSQALRSPRPPYFGMLMVDNGWQDLPDGHTGASLVVAWRDAVRLLHLAPHGAETLADLFAPVPFPDGLARPVAYTLATADDDADIGVRLKSDLLSFLTEHVPDHPGIPAVRRLTEAAVAVARRVQLASGDLLIVDNDRWGHGRESVVGSRPGPDGGLVLNPRELWSTTVG